MKRSLDIRKSQTSYCYIVIRNKVKYFFRKILIIHYTRSGKIRVHIIKEQLTSTEYYHTSHTRFGTLAIANESIKHHIDFCKRYKGVIGID